MQKKIGSQNFISVSVFPLLGVKEEYFYDHEENEKNFLELNGNFEENHELPKQKFGKFPYNSNELVENNIFSKSIFTNDKIINSHPRFGCLSRNIRTRKGKKVEILVPIYKDEKTSLDKTDDEPFPGYIYMDSMAFGMGCGCFQVTIGCCSLNGTLYMYDQLLPLTPFLVKIKFLLNFFLKILKKFTQNSN